MSRSPGPSAQRPSDRRHAVALLVLTCALATGTAAHADVDLVDLFRATLDPAAAANLDEADLDPGLLTPSDPLWPIHTYLRGEIALLRDEPDLARRTFRSLAVWADTDPLQDGWGATSLAVPALWRWASLAEADPTTGVAEIEQILGLADRLLKTRLALRLFRYEGLSLMPRLQEDLLRLLAILSSPLPAADDTWRRVLAYLEVSREADLPPPLPELVEELYRSGRADRDRIDLLRGKRFLDVREYRTAAEFLERARQGEDLQIAAEASFQLAIVYTSLGATARRAEIVSLLREASEDSQDPRIIQRARYELAIAMNRAGEGRDEAGFVRTLEQLIADYPDGTRSDTALHQLANHRYRVGDVERALTTYAQLRVFPGQNDWAETARLRPALFHYRRGADGDLDRALALLEELLVFRPDGDLQLLARFWIGRIHEDLGNTAEAREAFTELVSTNPLSFYGMRARLHLAHGADARTATTLEGAPREEFVGEFLDSRPGPVRPLTTYHERLTGALDVGLYREVLAAEERMREAFPSLRLEQAPLSELDAARLVPQASLLLGLRQVARAARDRDASSVNLLEVAFAVGQHSGDWELTMTMVMAFGETAAAARRESLHLEKGFLATAYPVRFREAILHHSERFSVPAHIVYAVARWESFLYPAALSPRRALGLFQIMPGTFEALDNRWNLLADTGIESREAYLLDPERSIGLWTRWLRDELLPRYDEDPVLAVMDHQAGYSAVRRWRNEWQANGIEGDIELMVETGHYGETRRFLRGVLASWMIAEAVDLLGGGE